MLVLSLGSSIPEHTSNLAVKRGKYCGLFLRENFDLTLEKDIKQQPLDIKIENSIFRHRWGAEFPR